MKRDTSGERPPDQLLPSPLIGSSNRLGLDGHERQGSADTDDSEELHREMEAMRLEDELSPPMASSSAQLKHPSFTPDMTISSDGTAMSLHPARAVPASERKPAFPRRKSSLKRTDLPSLSPLDLSLHTSASEIFAAMVPPPLTRQTTYSSLPPSPRLVTQDEAEQLFSGRGLGIKELEAYLGRMNGRSPKQPEPADEHEGVEEVDEVDDQFWPARSRRGTIDNGDDHLRPDFNSFRDRDDRSPSPDTLTERDLRSPSPDFHSSEHPPGSSASGAVPAPEISLWDLLTDEAGAEGWEGWVVDGKWERIQNFLAVPLAVEMVTLFGALLCLDGFLYNFTILPIRASFALLRILKNFLHQHPLYPIPPTHLHSIIRMLLIIIPTTILLWATDASKMYHTVRGQDTIKLYVIFNALEIADRLCCAFGQDVLDTLFARDTLAPSARLRGKGRKRRQARPYFFFALSLAYVLGHTLIYFYMLVSLNVAINSYDYTLLSLLISNQFVEIKGSVFKRFDKENLFQILCADIVERFQLSLMLTVIALRNVVEMSGSEIAFLPKSFIKGKGLVDSILLPVLFVIFSEMGVDWLKHAFITKFNHIRAGVYDRFADVLAKDVLLAGSLGDATRSRSKNRNHPLLLDQSPLVARRLGFASIPLACLVIRIGAQSMGMLTASSVDTDHLPMTWSDVFLIGMKWGAGIVVGASAWGCLVALKVLLGLSLLSYSALRQNGMDEREAEDVVNNPGRSAVGETKEEKEFHSRTREYLSSSIDDLPEYPPPSATATSPTSILTSDLRAESPTQVMTPRPPAGEKDGKKKWRLEDVERWTMVKRIW